MLDAERIAAFFPLARGERLSVAGEVDSTQAPLLAAAASLPDGSVVLSDCQRAGRGRRGRAWQSPPGASLALSMLAHSTKGGRWPPALALALGVAAAEALHRLGADGVRLKWPNDLLFDGDKLGGILVENCPGGVVAGIGINLRLRDEDRACIGQPSSDLFDAGGGVEPETLAAAIILAWDEVFESVRSGRIGAWLDRWALLDALRGRRVRVESGAQRLEGLALGIDGEGLLRVEVDGLARSFASAEVSVRPA